MPANETDRSVEFGELAVMPATHRVISFLEPPPGLKEVVACLHSGTSLHVASDEDPGISQCHALVKELKKLKEEGIKNATSSAPKKNKSTGINYAATMLQANNGPLDPKAAHQSRPNFQATGFPGICLKSYSGSLRQAA